MMRFGRYRFTCRFKDPAELPPYKGSTFRGIFGHALKRVVCAVKYQDCATCILQDRCLYRFVFDTPAAASGEKSGQSPSPMHPYVISSATDERRHYEPNDNFIFDLLLFGRANDELHYFIYAIDTIGEQGIGKRINGRATRFSLTSVTARDAVVYRADEGKVLAGDWTRDLRRELEAAYFSPLPDVTTLAVQILTPLRVKYQNRLMTDLPFHILIRTSLRRIATLCQAYGAGDPALDYRGLVREAQNIATDTDLSHLEWFDWERYSRRQDQRMMMGGVKGTIVYRGDLGRFVPILKFCEHTHLGKATTFGLGKIRVEV